MANYQFELIMALSDLVDVEADSKEEAIAEAESLAEEYSALVPDGYSIPWDNVDVILINSDAEDW